MFLVAAIDFLQEWFGKPAAFFIFFGARERSKASCQGETRSGFRKEDEADDVCSNSFFVYAFRCCKVRLPRKKYFCALLVSFCYPNEGDVNQLRCILLNTSTQNVFLASSQNLLSYEFFVLNEHNANVHTEKRQTE